MTAEPKKATVEPKTDTAVEKKDAAKPKDKSTSGAQHKDGEKSSETPSGYSRGEGQKPVSKAYKDNWNAIFAKKKKR